MSHLDLRVEEYIMDIMGRRVGVFHTTEELEQT